MVASVGCLAPCVGVLAEVQLAVRWLVGTAEWRSIGFSRGWASADFMVGGAAVNSRFGTETRR